MSKFILCPFGSGGDVNPYVWMGRLLKSRGHEVVVVTVPMFQEAVAKAGLPFRGVGSEEDYEAIVHDPRLWHPLRATEVVFKASADAIEPFFTVIREEVESFATKDDVVILAPFHLPAARLAREVLKVSLVTVHLQPIAMLSRHDKTVLLSGFEWMAELPVWLKKIMYAMPNPADLHLTPTVRRICKSYGVAGPRRYMNDWLHSPDGVLCLWPEWFAGRQPDWPRNAATVGFPLEDLRGQFRMPEGLEEFLGEGDKPVLLTAGTGNAQAAEFFEVGLEACQKVGCRALLGTRYREQLPATLPPFARQFDYLPFSQVLPHVAVAVHHGGIGTLSQCFAAGTPQLVIPMAHDQPDNAARMEKLGVGLSIPTKKLTVDKMVSALRYLLNDSGVKSKCAELAEHCQRGDAAANALRYLQSVLK